MFFFFFMFHFTEMFLYENRERDSCIAKSNFFSLFFFYRLCLYLYQTFDRVPLERRNRGVDTIGR